MTNSITACCPPLVVQSGNAGQTFARYIKHHQHALSNYLAEIFVQSQITVKFCYDYQIMATVGKMFDILYIHNISIIVAFLLVSQQHH